MQQQRRIRDHEKRTGVVNERAGDRGQKARRRKRHGREIDGHREDEPRGDRAPGLPREAKQVRQALHTAAHERDVRCIRREVVAASAHRDSNAGGLERRGVVHAVADHADRPVVRLGRDDPRQLVLGQAGRLHFRNAHAPRRLARRALVVAREQHRLHAGGPNTGHRFRGVSAERVGERQNARGRAVHRDVHDRAPPLPPTPRHLVRFGGRTRKTGRPRRHGAPADTGPHPAAGNHFEGFRLGKPPGLLPRAGRDGPTERMLGAGLRRAGKPEKFPLRNDSAHGFHGHDAGLRERQRSGLVKRRARNARETLQRVAFAHEEAVLRRVADGGHDRRRRREHERTRTEHDEHRNRAERLAGREPHRKSRGKRRSDDPRRPSVRQTHHASLPRVCGLHETDHALQRTIRPVARRDEVERAETVHGAARHGVPRPLVLRHRLAGHRRLVERGVAVRNRSVSRNGFARKNSDPVPGADLVRGNHALRSILRDDPRHAGRERHETLDPAPGAPHRPIFQLLAEGHDERHFSRGEDFPRSESRDERHRDEKVGLDVEGADQRFDGLDRDRHAAQEHRDPRRIDRRSAHDRRRGEQAPHKSCRRKRDLRDRHPARSTILFRARSAGASAGVRSSAGAFAPTVLLLDSFRFRVGHGSFLVVGHREWPPLYL